MYQFWVFTLFIQTGLLSFPTIYQADTVTVYKDLEKHEFVFEMDLFDFDLETFINGLSVTKETILRESLFQNLKFILKIIDGLPLKDTLSEVEINKIFTFTDKLLKI